MKQIWQAEYKRALLKNGIEGTDHYDIIMTAKRVIEQMPQPFKNNLIKWLNIQTRDDFMVHGGVWEDLLTAIFKLPTKE